MTVSKKILSFLSKASWIRAMFEEGERLRKIHGPENVYDFTLGNPNTEPPEEFHRELRRLAANPVPGMHGYMSNAGYPETRRAVAAALADYTGLPVTENHVVMTCGAGGALNVVLKAILNAGDEVIVLAPYFVEYRFYIDNHGGIIKEVETLPDFQLDLKAISEAIGPRTKAIILNSPNNPTGAVYPAESLSDLGRMLRAKEAELQTRICVISDEPYARIVYDGVAVPPVFNHIDNAVICTSHSKDLALPGERIGYLAASPKIEDVALLMEALVFCNRTLGFVNAPAIMQRLVTGLQGLSVAVAEYQAKRDLLCTALAGLGFELVKPSGAFYLFPRSPVPDDVAFVRAAQRHRLLLVPGSGFGRPGHFRIAYCVDRPTIVNSLPAWAELAREFGLPPATPNQP